MQGRIHLIGIGGAGMSALARIYREKGHVVSGSDIVLSGVTRALTKEGIRIFEGHRARQVHGADEVIYSSAIPPTNVERKEAEDMRLKLSHRSEGLARLMQGRDGVIVTGMHGKTTTTCLAARMCEEAGLEPGYMVGAECPSLNGGARLGKGRIFVAEADESDGSFLNYKPSFGIVTNIDREHLDHYGTLDKIRAAFRRFFEGVHQRGGRLILPAMDLHVRAILRKQKNIHPLYYGFGPGCDVRGRSLILEDGGSTFMCEVRGAALGKFRLSLPGRHNVLNALGVIGLGWLLGLKPEAMERGLRDCRGARRRFEVKLATPRLMVVDDYAHHPTEIDAVIRTCRQYGRRVVGVFQPHRYSRTKYLADSFGRSLSKLDELILTDIYGACEQPLEGVSVEVIRRSAVRHGMRKVFVEAQKNEVVTRLKQIIRPKDLVITLGAGDVGECSDTLVRSVTL
ncbi:MAG: UDP-N-acetylmuramate--L-alanine ligase [Candidatus Omnitrophica bacterium]|nr:UDP-N-acetylmuramate--L-alanine ligase [Candidatus Omnitrophota bacterium]